MELFGGNQYLVLMLNCITTVIKSAAQSSSQGPPAGVCSSSSSPGWLCPGHPTMDEGQPLPGSSSAEWDGYK